MGFGQHDGGETVDLACVGPGENAVDCHAESHLARGQTVPFDEAVAVERISCAAGAKKPDDQSRGPEPRRAVNKADGQAGRAQGGRERRGLTGYPAQPTEDQSRGEW